MPVTMIGLSCAAVAAARAVCASNTVQDPQRDPPHSCGLCDDCSKLIRCLRTRLRPESDDKSCASTDGPGALRTCVYTLLCLNWCMISLAMRAVSASNVIINAYSVQGIPFFRDIAAAVADLRPLVMSKVCG